MVMMLLIALASAAFGSPQPAEKRQLKWRSGKIVLSVSNSLLSQRLAADEDVHRAIRGSLSAWEAASDIAFQTRDSVLQSVSPKGVKGDGISLLTIASSPENLKLFPQQANSPAATTRVFFNARGEITEADIVLNPYVQFSTDGAIGTYDLQTVVTHEVGHLLGLDHSPVWGSRMFERTGKNAGTRSAALTLSDISAVKSLYGAKADDVVCCGSIVVKANAANHGKTAGAVAWAEEAATGRVVAATAIAADGVFRIGGIGEGKYRVFVQYDLAAGRVTSGSADVSLELGDDVQVGLDLPPAVSVPISYIGLNAQLAQLPLIVPAGQTHRIWAGGSAFAAEGVTPRPNSDAVFTNTDSLRFTEYGSNVRALSFEIRVAAETPAGEYTLPFEAANGVRRYMIGALSVIAN